MDLKYFAQRIRLKKLMHCNDTILTPISLALILGFGSCLPANAGGGDPDPEADYMEQIQIEQVQAEEQRSLSTWASRHTSFPEIPTEQAQNLLCFMETEDSRAFNLEKLCKQSIPSKVQSTPDPLP